MIDRFKTPYPIGNKHQIKDRNNRKNLDVAPTPYFRSEDLPPPHVGVKPVSVSKAEGNDLLLGQNLVF